MEVKDHPSWPAPRLQKALGIALMLLGLHPLLVAQSHPVLSVASLDDLYAHADAHGPVAEVATAQRELAALQSKAAVANTVNLRGNLGFTANNNFAQPVNFIPAEIFGGPAGTFREVTFGQQYVNVASITPQLDVVNPSAYARLRSARISSDLTEVTNLLNQRNQHEAIAAAYCQVRSLEAQLASALQSQANADSILAIARRRHEAGLVRLSDVSNAEANSISLADFVDQLRFREAQQIHNLKSILGMKADYILRIMPEPLVEVNAGGDPSSTLQTRQAMLQAELQASELSAQRLAFLPTVSVTAGFNWQQNSNEKQFGDAEWIDSRFVGLKVTMPIPTETRLWTAAEEYRINRDLKEIQVGNVQAQESNQSDLLALEQARTLKATESAQQVRDLRVRTFNSVQAAYLEGLVGVDALLIAFNDKLNAQLNLDAAVWNLRLQEERVKLFNSIR